MHTKPFLVALILIPLYLTACRDQEKKTNIACIPVTGDTSNGLLLADTIIYDILISNPNPDNTWATKCLSRLKREALIDSIFSMVYMERAIAYNFETREKLTVKQVKKMESAAGFSRDSIGMIQFTEAWYLDPASSTMTKRVISLVLGSNFYASNGELFGHKPVLRIILSRDKGQVSP
jgi:hypothetical protein